MEIARALCYFRKWLPRNRRAAGLGERMTSCRAALAVALAAIAGLGAAAAPPKAGKTQAVAFQIDIAHSGYAQFDKFSTPLKLRWKVNLGQQISYPLIADGKVLVTTANMNLYSGSILYVLDLRTGAILWQTDIDESFTHWSNAAYDGGAVFVIDFDGVVRAFDAGTGKLNWTVQLAAVDQVTSPPTASNGVLYVSDATSGGTIFALNEKNGQTLWSTQVDGFGFSAPTLGGRDGLYLSYTCYAYGLNSKTGKIRWNHWYDCGGGAGQTPVYTSNLLFARNADSSNLIFNAKNGAVKGIFGANPVPAFFTDASGDLMEITLSGNTLYGVHAATGIVAWSFLGDQNLDSAPIIINGKVIEGSSQGNLYVVDGDSGTVEWTTNVGAPIYYPNELSVNEPLNGLGAGEDTLIVPAYDTLLAYTSK
jgi:outer membrane protein assembly factor BamB